MLSCLAPKEATELFRDLLWCQARRRGVPLNKIHISTNLNISDGGIDATIDEAAYQGEDDVLVEGGTYYQIKAGKTESNQSR